MLEECSVQHHKTQTFRLASLPQNSLITSLLARGVDPANLYASVSVINRLQHPFTAEDVVDRSFRGNIRSATRFPVGRFGDGTIAVYYSSLEEATCRREMEFHLREAMSDQREHASKHPRSYSLISCHYSGTTADLRGREEKYPDLVSESDEGYPFCQSLGLNAAERGIQGFLTPSARRQGGVCAPVFDHQSLSEPNVEGKLSVLLHPEGLKFQEV